MAAGRDVGTRRYDTARDVFLRATGQDPGTFVDAVAVEAELRERERHGLDAGGDVKAQLEVLHRYSGTVTLDFTRQEDGRTVTDHNKLHAFTAALKAEAAVRDMGPGSGICMQKDGGWVGDPDTVARAEANDRYRADMAAQAQARLTAAGIKFAGPYNIFGSVA
jgi:hypothetical protein